MRSKRSFERRIAEDNKRILAARADEIRTQAHYTQHKIQPMQFCGLNKLGFLEGNVVKYVCRYNMKNGVEDLKKARHYLDKLIEREEKGTITL